MPGYTTRQVAEIVGLAPRQVRAWARQGLLSPGRSGAEYRFTFQDVVLLRTARELRDQDVPPRRIRSALASLREQLPGGRPLSAVRIAAEGERVVVREDDTVWEPDTGQVAFDFSVGELAARVEPLTRDVAADPAAVETLSSDAWFDAAFDLEAVSPARARDAYRRVLEKDPGHVEALLNLGRLLHEDGDAAAAERHYRRAAGADPSSALAAFNLGVALEDLGRGDEAEAAYRRALELDADLAEAHFNLAGLLEARGDVPAAVRHLATYRRLQSG